MTFEYICLTVSADGNSVLNDCWYKPSVFAKHTSMGRVFKMASRVGKRKNAWGESSSWHFGDVCQDEGRGVSSQFRLSTELTEIFRLVLETGAMKVNSIP